MTLDEYFAFEHASPTKHEYVDGDVYAMSGVSRRHNQIVGNVHVAVRGPARTAGCRTSIVDVKLQTPRAVYYPDVMVAWGPEPTNEYVEDAPCLLVEVTSPSTERIDRREKRFVYQAIASLRTYLIVDQHRRVVDWYARDTDGAWTHATLVERGEIVLECPPVMLTLDAIYEDVALPPADAARVREEEGEYDPVRSGRM